MTGFALSRNKKPVDKYLFKVNNNITEDYLNKNTNILSKLNGIK